jgi:hypothetical protein
MFLSACAAERGEAAAEGSLRVATFNVSLYKDKKGGLTEAMRQAPDSQRRALRSIISNVDPDILILNEFDFDEDGEALRLFANEIDGGYRYRLALASNTGAPSGYDLDQDGRSDHPAGSREYGNDSFGFGVFPGQYAIAVLSRHPIMDREVRTFRKFLWRDLPGNLLPQDYYGKAEEALRLSSKTHAVVPVSVGEKALHLVVAHPTPPGFDGDEDRNGRRNYDEIRLLHAIVSDDEAEWLSDDEGQTEGLGPDASFVIFGDLNADPSDTDVPAGASRHAISDLLSDPRIIDPRPQSRGGSMAHAEQGGANLRQKGDPRFDTADFSDRQVGNLRVDYVLPSADLAVRSSGVYWPERGEEGFELIGEGWPVISSDHRLVWADITWTDDQ